MPVTLRPATVLDVERVARLHVEAWQWAYSGLLPDDFLANLSVTRRADGWRSALLDAADRMELLLCEREGSELLGFVAAGPARGADVEEAGEVYALYLAQRALGHGYGARLLTRAEATLLERGFRRAVLWVLQGNQHALRFYERQGWREDGSTKHETFAGGVLVEVRMAKELVIPRAAPR